MIDLTMSSRLGLRSRHAATPKFRRNRLPPCNCGNAARFCGCSNCLNVSQIQSSRYNFLFAFENLQQSAESRCTIGVRLFALTTDEEKCCQVLQWEFSAHILTWLGNTKSIIMSPNMLYGDDVSSRRVVARRVGCNLLWIYKHQRHPSSPKTYVKGASARFLDCERTKKTN